MSENLRKSGINKNRIEGVPGQNEQCFRLKSKSNFSPARKMEDLELAEIIDVSAVQPLMDNFYKLTNIPLGLNDLKGNVLVRSGWQDICIKFHRAHPETCKHCVESNIKLSSGVSPGEFKMCRCKNNMWDVVTPIMVGGRHIGYIFAGQFFFEDEPLDYELFRSQARKYGFNEDEYITALKKVPRLSREAVDTGMAFLMGFANMLSQLGYSNIKLSQLLVERDAVVDALQQSEKREQVRSDELEAVLDSVPAAVWIAQDPRALHITGNRFSYEWLNIPMGANVSKSAPEGERPETFRLFKDGAEISPADMPLQMSAAGTELKDYEIDVIFSDGEVRHLLGNARPLRDEKGNSRGSVSAFIDITKNKKIEKALRLSNIYNRSLIEASLDPLVTIGPDGKITDVSNSTEIATGYSRDELIGTDFSDYFTEPDKAKEGYQHVFLEGLVRDYPLEIQHKDGHITPVLYNASVYRDENGEVIGVFAAARDITELKKAENALKKAHDNLEKLVEERTIQLENAYQSLKENEKSLSEAQKLARVGNWDWDLVTGKVQWSDELYEIFGRDPQKPGANYEELLNYVHPDDRDYVDKTIKKGLTGGRLTGGRHGIDYRIVLDNGEERAVHAERETIFDQNDAPVRSRGIIQDITERKKAEEALEKIQETHIKEIHHRIKNNLQVISSLLSLEAEKLSDKKTLEAFRESQNRVTSMALIHEELYKGNELDTLDFADYLQKLTADLFDSYNLRNSGITLNLDLENIHLDMDTAIPLGIIVNELVSNALKHAFPSGESGEIHISLCKKENFAANHNIPVSDLCCKGKDSFNYVLAVEDDGRGIPEEIEFGNTDSLGLQLVNLLVEQINGYIKLKRNHGTKFTICFGNTER